MCIESGDTVCVSARRMISKVMMLRYMHLNHQRSLEQRSVTMCTSVYTIVHSMVLFFIITQIAEESSTNDILKPDNLVGVSQPKTVS